MKLLPGFWRKHFLTTELLLAVAISSAFGYWCIWHGGAVQVERILH
jgi:hypothetical protein